jgi:hypothetical protein
MSKNTAQQEICMKKNHERSWQDLDKNFRQSWQDLASMARLNNLGKILVISWQDLSVLPRPCHDLPRSGKILQDLAKIFNLGRTGSKLIQSLDWIKSNSVVIYLCVDVI